MKPTFQRSVIANVASQLASSSKEAARALPDSKGGETPKSLQMYRTEVYSYFTRPTAETDLLYSAENWVRIKLTLETAGPVAVGTSHSLAPVLSGRGRLLDTGVEFECFLAKGTRFYVTSQTVNRISVTIEPIPWLEQISGDMAMMLGLIAGRIGQIGNAIVGAIGGLRGGSSSAPKIDESSPVPCPPRGIGAPRLTPIIRKR